MAASNAIQSETCLRTRAREYRATPLFSPGKNATVVCSFAAISPTSKTRIKRVSWDIAGFILSRSDHSKPKPR
jgi:hypothetical protein